MKHLIISRTLEIQFLLLTKWPLPGLGLTEAGPRVSEVRRQQSINILVKCRLVCSNGHAHNLILQGLTFLQKTCTALPQAGWARVTSYVTSRPSLISPMCFVTNDHLTPWQSSWQSNNYKLAPNNQKLSPCHEDIRSLLIDLLAPSGAQGMLKCVFVFVWHKFV